MNAVLENGTLDDKALKVFISYVSQFPEIFSIFRRSLLLLDSQKKDILKQIRNIVVNPLEAVDFFEALLRYNFDVGQCRGDKRVLL